MNKGNVNTTFREIEHQAQNLRRVAVYARVSTDEENQKNSYKMQIEYYKDVVDKNPEWELVEVYADEGISGTQVKHRSEFLRMLGACRRGEIDIVLCKSISRFARNTVDFLECIRELKSRGIAVIFEKENINTMEIESEFIVSLFASFAQAESESISRNVTWGIEKSFKEGRIHYKFNNTMGYRLDEDGKPVIVEKEAEIVREIFRLFSSGVSMGKVAKLMTDRGIIRRNGSSVWNRRNVEIILKNEKYAGMVVLQKSYTVDPLTHKRAKNTGQKPQYVFKNVHEAIVSESLYEKVRGEFLRRSLERGRRAEGVNGCRSFRRRKPNRSFLNGIVMCPYCGSRYRRVIWKSNGRRYAVWRCGNRLEGGKDRCSESCSIREVELIEIIKNIVKSVMPSFKESCVDDIVGYDEGILSFDDSVEKQGGFEKYVELVYVYGKTDVRVSIHKNL